MRAPVPRPRLRVLAALLVLLPAVRPEAVAGPGVPPAVDGRFAERRARLAARLGSGYALVLGQPLTDVLHPRQEGHLLYLTGVDDPGAALLLAGAEAPPLRVETRGGPRATREVLWLLHANPRFRQFHGLRWRVGRETERALRVGLTRPHPGRDELGPALAGLLPDGARLHLPAYGGPDHAPVRELRGAVADSLARLRPDLRTDDLHPVLSEMRAVKDDEELRALREAIAVTVAALRDAAVRIRPGSSEAAVEGALLDGMRRRGARPAFPPVVASGANAAVPHYMRNADPLEQGALLLIDAGAAVERYAADLTRVFPVGGRFTARQREVIGIVRRAQAAAIDAVRPGATFGDIDRAARAVITEAGYGDFFLHGTSHHVGLDVHDPGPTTLRAGMTLTVEPGIYLLDEGLGVRIEDIVLVTADGGEVLTAALPSDPDAAEALVRGD